MPNIRFVNNKQKLLINIAMKALKRAPYAYI